MKGTTFYLTADDLNIDAAYPICSDSQYLSDSTINYIAKRNKKSQKGFFSAFSTGYGFHDSEIKAMRLKDKTFELIRSLLYSSQIVLHSRDLMYDDYFHALYSSDEDLKALSHLIKNGDIIVGSFWGDFETEHEKGLGESSEFMPLYNSIGYDYHSLLFDDARCYNDFGKAGYEIIDLLPSITQLAKSDIYYSLMFGKNEIDKTKGKFEESMSRIYDLGERHLFREEIYEYYFTDVPFGAFGNRRMIYDGYVCPELHNNNGLLMAKKVVDFCHNHDIALRLNSHIFTPLNMPTLTNFSSDKKVSEVSLTDFVKNYDDFIECFNWSFNQSFYLPLMKNLTLADVVEIREWDEWKSFIDAKFLLLTNSENFAEKIMSYKNTFIALQKALSEWAIKQPKFCKPKKSLEKVKPYLSIIFRVGVKAISLGIFGQDDFGAFIKLFRELIESSVSEAVKNCSIQIAHVFINADSRRINKELSTSMEILTKTVSEFEEIADDIQKSYYKAHKESTVFGNIGDYTQISK